MSGLAGCRTSRGPARRPFVPLRCWYASSLSLPATTLAVRPNAPNGTRLPSLPPQDAQHVQGPAVYGPTHVRPAAVRLVVVQAACRRVLRRRRELVAEAAVGWPAGNRDAQAVVQAQEVDI